MGSGNQHPLDELSLLAEQVGQIGDLESLRPVFYRVEEIIKQHTDDFEVQLAASELKQKVIARGTELRQASAGVPASAPDKPRPQGSPFDTLHTPNVPSAPPTATSRPQPEASPFDTAQVPRVPNAPPMQGVSQDSWIGAPPPLPPGKNIPPPAADLPKPMAPPRTQAPFPAPQPPVRWKRSLLVGGLIGLLLAVGIITMLVRRTAKTQQAVAPVSVALSTTPNGASIRINGETRCAADCKVDLPPGDYQITAFLDGYVPAAGALKILAGKPAQMNLALAPQPSSLRIVTDLATGRVTYDTEPAAELQDGQFALNDLTPGAHTFRITSGTGEATFTVKVAPAQQPVVSDLSISKDWNGLLVSSLGSRARAISPKAARLALNGQAQSGEVGPDGLDLTGFQPGVVEFTLGEGASSRTMTESFGPAPSMVVMLKAEGGAPTVGTLIISSNEDNARVFINGNEYPRRVQRGQLRIQTTGSMTVRVAKDGFEVAPPQTANVVRGSETRLDFKLQAIPQMAVLQIRGATPGAEVFIDQKSAGKVGDDGSFNDNAVTPGEHTIELRRDQFLPRRLQRVFRTGLPVAVSGLDVAMAPAVGTVRITKNPAETAVTYRRADENQPHELRGAQMELPAGSYLISGRAPGYTDKTERVDAVAGETRTLELALVARVAVAAVAPPAPKAGGMADFEDPNAWSKQGDLWVHKGGGFIPFKLTPNGVFTFNVRLLKGGGLFRGGRIRWAVQFADAKNYDLYEMDTKQLWSKVIIGGKTYERGKYEHGVNEKDMAYTVQVDIAPDKLVHRLRKGNEWVVLDTWQEPGRNFTEGKFGFLIQGNDEIGVADFSFQPR